MNQNESDPGPTNTAKKIEIRQALPRSVQLIVLLLVFLSGGIVGSIITTKFIHNKMEAYRQNAPVFANDVAQRLIVLLDLTDEQATQVNEILRSRHPRLVEFRNQGSLALHDEFDAMVDEITTVLDQKQLKQWEAMSESVRRRFLPPKGSTQYDRDSDFAPASLGGQPRSEIFKVFDMDRDSSLSQDEVPPRMWRRLSALDLNNDGKLTFSEFQSHE